MTRPILVALPEAWRVEMFRSLEAQGALRAQLLEGALRGCEVMDWGSRWYPAEQQWLVVAALDLSTAELLVKVPAGAQVVAVDNDVFRPSLLGGGRRRFLRQARRAPVRWVKPEGRPRTLPPRLGDYLESALSLIRAREGRA